MRKALRMSLATFNLVPGALDILLDICDIFTQFFQFTEYRHILLMKDIGYVPDQKIRAFDRLGSSYERCVGILALEIGDTDIIGSRYRRRRREKDQQ
jgi:hypothetical protein